MISLIVVGSGVFTLDVHLLHIILKIISPLVSHFSSFA